MSSSSLNYTTIITTVTRGLCHDRVILLIGLYVDVKSEVSDAWMALHIAAHY